MADIRWDELGIIIAIIGFTASGIHFGFSGLKAWKRADASEQSKVMWGKIQFALSGLSIIISLCFLIILINIKNDIIIDYPPTEPVTELPTVIESQSVKTNGVYVYKQSYQGATYSGYVNDQREPDGAGTMYYSDGKVYTGNWVDGIQDGQGKMIYTNSDTYDGEWHNGKRNGIGTYTWKDGKSYVGGYVDDARNGEGTFFGWVDLTNGYSGTYYGESKNDQFDGAGFFQFDNGDQFDGIYKDNLYWTGVYTRKDGTTFHVVNGKAE